MFKALLMSVVLFLAAPAVAMAAESDTPQAAPANVTAQAHADHQAMDHGKMKHDMPAGKSCADHQKMAGMSEHAMHGNMMAKSDEKPAASHHEACEECEHCKDCSDECHASCEEHADKDCHAECDAANH